MSIDDVGAWGCGIAGRGGVREDVGALLSGWVVTAISGSAAEANINGISRAINDIGIDSDILGLGLTDFRAYDSGSLVLGDNGYTSTW